jgi:acetyl/propionyl-CoA carboxylase alpha subunit
MRVIRKESDLAGGISSARRESKEAFGSDKLLIEKYFETVRHVEIQIMGDCTNNCIHLYERDCSIQRRHQKVIEETPSPVLTPELRNRMGQTAVTIGQAINYQNAGTVEFILDEKGNYYFLEVNTRLQVEHPITEAITGLDLVYTQIKIAEGYTLQELGLIQDSIRRVGHAIQCRLYAEDPLNEFFPSPGKLHKFLPARIEGVRYDSGVQSGTEISIYYDPMIVKVIAYGRDRAESLQKMRRALSQSIIIGPATNQLFLLQVLNHPLFVAGEYNTHFIDNHLPLTKRTEFSNLIHDSIYQETAIVSTLYFWWLNTDRRTLQKHVRPGFTNVLNMKQFKEFKINQKQLRVEYTIRKPKLGLPNVIHFDLNIGDSRFEALFEKHPQLVLPEKSSEQMNELWCTINGVRRQYLTILQGEEDLHIHSNSIGRLISVKLLPRLIISASKESEQSGNVCKAKMTGKILSVAVKPGDTVKVGDVVVVMESMKMETRITAFKTGKVDQVLVKAGQVVDGGQTLVSFIQEQTE